MPTSRLGIVLDSLQQPVKEALRTAASLELRHIEMPAVREVDPGELSRTGRRALATYLNGLGLNLEALGGDLGGGRFADSSAVEQRLEKTRRIMEMANELRVPSVTTHLGVVSEEVLKRGYLQEALRHLAEVSDRTGTRVAIETGGADPQVLGRLLREIGGLGLGVCYDPASLVMDGFDPLSGVEPLSDRIFVAHVRDAVAGVGQRSGRETRLGDGQVDVPEYLAALDQAGFRDVPLIRRTGSDHAVQEIAEARARLERLIR